ncbi:MAG: hypothetical protein KC445_08775 [Anaerolineales bacterium]|nr:hypothetical protein [Anaerolineales bacterium]
MLKQLFAKVWGGQRAERRQWDAGLVWFRLRYRTSNGPTRSIRLLSRPEACGRVALYFRPGEAVSELYLGLPETHVRLLQRMAADFDFSLKPRLPEVAMPVGQRLTAVAELPWERPFLAHVVNELLFVSPANGESPGKNGRFLPQPPAKAAKEKAGYWQLPATPPSGLTTQPPWRNPLPPAHLVAAEVDPRRWRLGRTPKGIPLQASGRINIYGRQEAVAEWLVHQVTQMVALDPAQLVILDGAGDLVPRLKRKAAVTRLLGEQLAYIDINNTSLVDGFNPLAPVPEETEAALLQRWQRWFRGMNVQPQGIALLAQAQAAGIADIPALRKWLSKAAREGQAANVSSLNLALNRLTATRSLREWLEWPVNRFEKLTTGALFLTCQGKSWENQQLLLSALMAICHMPAARLVLHRFPWQANSTLIEQLPRQTVLSNGPILANTLPILVQCSANDAQVIGKQLLNGDKLLMETLQLLEQGEGMLLTEKGPVLTDWSTNIGQQNKFC